MCAAVGSGSPWKGHVCRAGRPLRAGPAPLRCFPLQEQCKHPGGALRSREKALVCLHMRGSSSPDCTELFLGERGIRATVITLKLQRMLPSVRYLGGKKVFSIPASWVEMCCRTGGGEGAALTCGVAVPVGCRQGWGSGLHLRVSQGRLSACVRGHCTESDSEV